MSDNLNISHRRARAQKMYSVFHRALPRSQRNSHFWDMLTAESTQIDRFVFGEQKCFCFFWTSLSLCMSIRLRCQPNCTLPCESLTPLQNPFGKSIRLPWMTRNRQLDRVSVLRSICLKNVSFTQNELCFGQHHLSTSEHQTLHILTSKFERKKSGQVRALNQYTEEEFQAYSTRILCRFKKGCVSRKSAHFAENKIGQDIWGCKIRATTYMYDGCGRSLLVAVTRT